MARTRAYRNGALVAENFSVEEVADYVADPAGLVWIDLCEPGQDELEAIGEELQLHSLALEDAAKKRQRAKIDRYQTHLFVTAHQVTFDVDSGRLRTSEVDAFVTRQALVTVRNGSGFDIDAVVHRWDSSGDLTKFGVAFLLYGLLDHVVDSHFEAAQSLDDAVEELEDLLFDDRPHDVEVHRRSFQLHKSLVLLRRAIVPMRDMVNTLLRRDLEMVTADLAPFYQDISDHVLRAAEWTEALRDIISTVLETNVTIQGNRLNAIMKKVTSWAAIIAVPTAITGFYGQNLPYPGYGSPAGFWVSSSLIAVLSVGLYVIFRRRDWI